MADTKEQYTLVVSGAREWVDKKLVENALADVQKRTKGKTIVLCHGACRGLDTIAAGVAKDLGWTVRAFPAEWGKYGRSAGPRRNRQMLDAKADLVLLFHDDIDSSKGTRDMLNACKERGCKHKMIRHEPAH